VYVEAMFFFAQVDGASGAIAAKTFDALSSDDYFAMSAPFGVPRPVGPS